MADSTLAHDRIFPLSDRLLFLSAALDALAGHRYRTADRAVTPTPSSSLDRLRHFLLRHGKHPAFAKVSAPMLRNRASIEVAGFPFASYKPFEMNEVRNWEDDPTFAEMEPTFSDRDLLLRWSYPGILYVDFRLCMGAAFMSENEQVRPEESNTFDRDEPYYRYISNRGELWLCIPVSFLAVTIQRAINSFEEEASARDILPFAD